MIQGFSWPNNTVQPNGLNTFATQPTPDADASTALSGGSLSSPVTQELSTQLLDSTGTSAPLLQLIALLTQLLLMMSGNAQNAFADSLSPTSNQLAADTQENQPAQNQPAEPQPAADRQNATVAADKTDNDKQDQTQEANAEAPQAPESTENKTDAAADREVSDTQAAKDVENTKDAEPPENAVNVRDFGAKGDGVSDDQAAIQSAIDEAKATGKTVWMPEGTYNHSGVLTLDGTKMEGAGDKTVLHATNPHEGAIKLTGDGSELSNLTTSVNASERSSMPNAASVLVQNASNASVSNVTTKGACSNGIRLDNATGSHISNNLVLGSNADGIAVMNGSSNNLVQHNVVYQAGDDSFSDNSYTNEAKQDANNTFDGNLSLDNAYGRGMALAGSKNATVTNNVISGSKWIGIWADTDPNSGTMESAGHRIENNTVINSPNGAPVQSNGPGSVVSGTRTEGAVPDLSAILGWDPGALPDRYSFAPNYQPGTGNGANNTAGNRS